MKQAFLSMANTLLAAFLIVPSAGFAGNTPFRRSRHVGFGVSTELRYSDEAQMSSTILGGPAVYQKMQRDKLKKDLAVAAIGEYDFQACNSGMKTVAEDLMKELELLRPLSSTAYRSELNARWNFVFTGEPTIGMMLITLLSRISVGFPAVDFRDVFLEVCDNQSLVKAVVLFSLFGCPVELNIFTSLRPNNSCPQGITMIERFEGIKLQGVDIPIPESWHSDRNLEISYLDEDIMIARTAGGEPHLLVRQSSYFEEAAKEKYGDNVARRLVDRAYGESDKSSSNSPMLNHLAFASNGLSGTSNI